MARLVALLFLFAALINLAPVPGALSPDRMEAAYGVVLEDPSLVVLMRHRALLFGVVGLLLGAAFRRPLRPLATGAGLFSMLGFIGIALAGDGNAALARLAAADAVGSLALLAGWWLDRRLEAD